MANNRTQFTYVIHIFKLHDYAGRENARIRYQHFHSLSSEKQAELRQKWAEHEKLSETEREKLRKESPELYYDPDVDQ